MDALFGIEPLDQFKNVSQDILYNLYENNETATTLLENSVVVDAKREIKQLITDYNYKIDEVAATIERKSWNQDKVNYFVTTLKERRTDLLYTLLAHNHSTHGESMTNFNWILKVVLGTSELKSMRYPLLQLILNTKIINGKEKQTMYELNKTALGKLINVLEDLQ